MLKSHAHLNLRNRFFGGWQDTKWLHVVPASPPLSAIFATLHKQSEGWEESNEFLSFIIHLTSPLTQNSKSNFCIKEKRAVNGSIVTWGHLSLAIHQAKCVVLDGNLFNKRPFFLTEITLQRASGSSLFSTPPPVHFCSYIFFFKVLFKPTATNLNKIKSWNVINCQIWNDYCLWCFTA